ncbi:hypothetical protein [Leifsonia sp. Root112D2]|uniref:hypothetical protein n=1 Tax=Leifsonia sp. Root112D2 TaxID=1736426 RepID=UPI0006F59165|nr:hypothetical protein [Leifsonia sp. Root112D2]KQV08156.1 hypothetical protein ASC63_13550 [Leifsonia sp. Root112D2]
MIWFDQFWAANGDTVIAGILIAIGSSVAAWLLVRAWRAVATILGAIFRLLYWLLIGWWMSKLRRWVTGSPW